MILISLAIIYLAVILIINDKLKVPEHKWVTKKHPLYNSVRYCPKTEEIEIKSHRLTWGDNFANLKIEDLDEA